MLNGRLRLGNVLLYAFLVLVVFWASNKQIKSRISRGDIDTYLNASRLLLHGENIYAIPNRGVDYYVYPPLLAALLIPLTLFPIDFVIYLWCSLKIPVIVWTTRALYEAMSGQHFSALSRRARWIIGFLPILLTARFILHDLSYGQVHIFVLALAVLGLRLASNSKPLGGGVLIGVSAAIKVISLPLAIWWFVKKNFRGLAGLVAGVSAGLLAPALIVGFDKNLFYLRVWLQNIILDEASQKLRWPLHINFSLHAELIRFFSDVTAFEYGGQEYKVSFFRLPSSYLHASVFIIMGAVVLIIVIYAWRYKNAETLVADWGGIALTFTLIPIFTPVSLEHHFLVLLPGHVFIVYVWYCMKLKDRWFKGLVVGSFVLNTLTAELFVGNDLRNVFLAVGCLVCGTLMLSVSIFRAAACLTSNCKTSTVRPVRA